ncbi:hypothetical protein [Burkholderia pseudomallei]|uniref:hypothetical protein n=1 Tax=Burkholderia pseudomallei TaxID=28450 RepID=UPI0012F4D1AA|nr:hypothetical protein [Burkholderia pseudomallei]
MSIPDSRKPTSAREFFAKLLMVRFPVSLSMVAQLIGNMFLRPPPVSARASRTDCRINL